MQRQRATKRASGWQKTSSTGLPTRKKDAPPNSIRFRDYVTEFLEDYARHWKPSTTYRNDHAITHQRVPVFGDVPLASITRADVMRLCDGMASRSGIFNLVLPVLAVMRGYAEQLGYRRKGSNPCRGMPRFKRALPECYRSPAEFRRLATRLRAHALSEANARYAHLADEVVMDAASRVCTSIASALGFRA